MSRSCQEPRTLSGYNGCHRAPWHRHLHEYLPAPAVPLPEPVGDPLTYVFDDILSHLERPCSHTTSRPVWRAKGERDDPGLT